MKRGKQRSKDGDNIMIHLRRESQGRNKSNSRGLNHGLFTFLMVQCLGISIKNDMV